MPSEQQEKKQRVDAPPEVPLYVKKLSADASLPKRGSAGAAGYDLARCGCVCARAAARSCRPPFEPPLPRPLPSRERLRH